MSDKSLKEIAKLKNLTYLNMYADADIPDQGFQDLAASSNFGTHLFYRLSQVDILGLVWMQEPIGWLCYCSYQKLSRLDLFKLSNIWFYKLL